MREMIFTYYYNFHQNAFYYYKVNESTGNYQCITMMEVEGKKFYSVSQGFFFRNDPDLLKCNYREYHIQRTAALEQLKQF